MRKETITYTAKGIIKSNRGTARKDGIDYEMRELQTRWKLVNVVGTYTTEFVWDKKDIPTLSDWCAELTKNGYEILLAD